MTDGQLRALIKACTGPELRDRRRDAALAGWRRGNAVELAYAGHGCDAIAEEVGYTNRGTAWRVIQDALKTRVAEGVDELRELDLERREGLHRAHWHQAIAGDLTSTAVILRAMEQRANRRDLHRPGILLGGS